MIKQTAGRDGLGDFAPEFARLASHSAEDIDVLCDTVCEMDKGVLKKIKG